jgi:uncharacterized protein YraI
MRAPVRRLRERAGPAGELRDSPTRRSVAVLITAAALGVLLIWGVPSLAFYQASAMGAQLSISSGTLSTVVSGPTTAYPSIGTAPSGVIVRSGSVGVIPGIQSETLTYSVTNGGTDRVPSAQSYRLIGTVTDATAWAAIQPYIQVQLSVGGAVLSTITTTASGFDVTVPRATPLAGGGAPALPVVVTFTLPASSSGVDLLRALQGARATTASIRAMLAVQLQVTLTQVPIGG